MKQLFTSMIVLLVLIIGCSSEKKAGSTPPNEPLMTKIPDVPGSTPDTVIALSPGEVALMNKARTDLVELAKVSESAKEALALYDSCNVPAKFYADGQLQVVTAPPEGRPFFFLVCNPTPAGSLAPGQVEVAAMFNADIQSMVINNCGFSGFINGMFLAHELQHAYDFLAGIEPPSAPGSAEWIAGEFRAHNRSFMILNDYTKGEWKKLAVKSGQVRDSIVKSIGGSEAAAPMGAIPGDSALLVGLFPNLSYDDLSALNTQLNIDATMMMFRMRKLDDSTFSERAMGFLQGFYNTYGIN